MTGMRKIAPALITAGLLVSASAQATLIDRGSGLLYDTVLNVTWLQDANLARTNTFGVSGIHANGIMTWSTANSWIAAMNTANYLGYHDWRMPTTGPVNGSSFIYEYAVNGSTDIGYNITSPNSELSTMYYVDLGLKGIYSPSGQRQYDFGIFRNGTYGFGREANVGLVNNLQSYSYWSGTAYEHDPTGFAWGLSASGYQNLGYQVAELNVWAVRSGDVAAAAVPEPMTVALFGLGLAGLAVARRRRSFGAS